MIGKFKKHFYTLVEMRAQILAHPSPVSSAPLSGADLPIPELAAGQLLIHTLACGVCHTDLHLVEGELAAHHLPLVPGHQVVGTVVKTGAGVAVEKIGQRVGVPWLHSTCGVCEFCKRGEENLCPYAKFTGWHTDGGYAEYLVADANYVVPIPARFADSAAAPLLCAGVVGFRSLRLAGIQPRERVGLFGFGAAGHLALQVLAHWECSVSVFTRGAGHRAQALELGARWAGSAEDLPPEPLDRAIIFAPAGELVPLALRKLRPGGTLAINAIHMSDIPAMEYPILYGERVVRSVANATRQDAVDFMALAERIPLRAEVQTYPLLEANRALQDLKAGKIQGAAVLKCS
jgi:alcohol dehydrogenase, propanol-preferring